MSYANSFSSTGNESISQPGVTPLVEKIKSAYQSLSHGDTDAMKALYTTEVYFEDPAHEIHGIKPLLKYFDSLTQNLESCEFKFHHWQELDGHIYLTWTMHFHHKKLQGGSRIQVEGASHLKYCDDKIFFHKDYFDLGAMVYENVPLLRNIVGLIKSRLGQTTS